MIIKVTHFGIDYHTVAWHSIPCVYVNQGFDRLITYEGNNPWSGGSVIEESVPAYPEGGLVFQPTEYWASFVDNDGAGLTLYLVPQSPYWYVERFPDDGTNTLIPAVSSDIPADSIIETTAYLIVGNYLDARDIIYLLRESGSPPTVWEFNRENNSEGWVASNQLTPFVISGGILKTSSTGTDPYMQVWSALDIDASVYKTIEIRMKVSAGNSASVYFTTIADGLWDGNKVKYFNVTPGNSYVTYNLDMGTIGTWSGRISQIRLDPTDTSSNIEVDYIRFIECSAWSDVMGKYNSYVSGSASWTDVIDCYNQYASP